MANTGYLVEVRDAQDQLLGDGPISTLLSANVNNSLDGAGSWGASFPASDIRALDLLQNERRIIVRNDDRILIHGIIRNRKVKEGADGIQLDVEGPDILDELKRRNVLIGRIYEQRNLVDVIADLFTLVPGWTFTIHPVLQFAIVDMRFDGISVLAALQELYERYGMHIRLSTTVPRRLEVGVFGESNGLRITKTEVLTPKLLANPHLLLINRIESQSDTERVFNRLYLQGAGEGTSALQLDTSTRSDPYDIHSEVNPDGTISYYIEDAISIGQYGVIERLKQFKEISALANTPEAILAASNALYDAGAEFLQRHAQPLELYNVNVVRPRQAVNVGDKVHIDYKGQVETRNGLAEYLVVKGDYWILEAKENITSEAHTVTMQVGNIDRQEDTVARQVKKGIESAENRDLKPAVATNVRTYTYDRFLTSQFPSEMTLEVSNSTRKVERVKLRFATNPLVSTSAVSASELETITAAGGSAFSGDVYTPPVPEGETPPDPPETEDSDNLAKTKGTKIRDSITDPVTMRTARVLHRTDDAEIDLGDIEINVQDAGVTTSNSITINNGGGGDTDSSGPGATRETAITTNTVSGTTGAGGGHGHSISARNSGNAGAHAHTIASRDTGSSAGGLHNHNIGTVGDDERAVRSITGWNRISALIGNASRKFYAQFNATGRWNTFSSGSGSHRHNVGASVTGSSPEHLHSVPAGSANAVGSHTHSGPSHNHSNSHAHPIPNHSHTIPSHTHGNNAHSHNIPAHGHGIAVGDVDTEHRHDLDEYTGLINQHVHFLEPHKHEFVLPEHIHVIGAHQHRIPGHSHQLTFGVTIDDENDLPSKVKMYIGEQDYTKRVFGVESIAPVGGYIRAVADSDELTKIFNDETPSLRAYHTISFECEEGQGTIEVIAEIFEVTQSIELPATSPMVQVTPRKPALGTLSISATAGDGFVNLRWPLVTDEDQDGYIIQWRRAGTATWTEVAPIRSNSHTVSSLTNGALYEFRVAIRDENGMRVGRWSRAVQATPRASTGPAPVDPVEPIVEPDDLGVPQNLKATINISGGLRSAAISWDAVARATSYDVEVIPRGPRVAQPLRVQGTMVNYFLGNPAVATWVIRVRARNADQIGRWSPVFTLTASTTTVGKPAGFLWGGEMIVRFRAIPLSTLTSKNFFTVDGTQPQFAGLQLRFMSMGRYAPFSADSAIRFGFGGDVPTSSVINALAGKSFYIAQVTKSGNDYSVSFTWEIAAASLVEPIAPSRSLDNVDAVAPNVGYIDSALVDDGLIYMIIADSFNQLAIRQYIEAL